MSQTGFGLKRAGRACGHKHRSDKRLSGKFFVLLEELEPCKVVVHVLAGNAGKPAKPTFVE